MRGSRRFRWLLRILPADTREAHGHELEQVLRDSYAERHQARHGAIRFWLAVVFDILRVAPRQHAEAAVQDVRYAARSFRRTPGFTLAAILTIALGTGAVTAIFAVVNAVLLRPLPYDEPERVTLVWARHPDGNRVWLAPAELEDARANVPSLEHIVGLTDLELALTGSGAPEQLHAVAASASLLDVFGIRPLRGRGFTSGDDLDSATRVAILSDSTSGRRCSSPSRRMARH